MREGITALIVPDSGEPGNNLIQDMSMKKHAGRSWLRLFPANKEEIKGGTGKERTTEGAQNPAVHCIELCLGYPCLLCFASKQWSWDAAQHLPSKSQKQK